MWKYKGKEVKSIDDFPEDSYGFIYQITHIPSGRKYIGKKVLFFKRNVKIGKRELAKIKEERKKKGIGGRPPKKKEVIKESDWKTYYGSQKEMKKLVKKSDPKDFEREILQIVDDKKKLTYFEAKLLFSKGVLENNEKYINNNILAKFYSKDFK